MRFFHSAGKFSRKFRGLALALAGAACLCLPGAAAQAACGWDSHSDFQCNQHSISTPNTTTTAIQTVLNIPGITAGGNITAPPVFLSPGGGAVDTPTTPITLTNQMQQIANELAQLGISFDVIEAIMEPMTEEERVAFLATVEAMTTVQLIANFGN
jgi:hypothetical protein